MPAFYGRGLNVCLRWSRPRKYLFDLVKLLYWPAVFCPSRFRAMLGRRKAGTRPQEQSAAVRISPYRRSLPRNVELEPRRIPQDGVGGAFLFRSGCEKVTMVTARVAKGLPRGGRRNHRGLRYPLQTVGDACHGNTSAAAPATGSTLRPRSSLLSRQAWSGFRRSSSPRPGSGRAASRPADY